MTDKVYLGILIAMLILVIFGNIKLTDSFYKTKRKLADKKDKLKKLLIPLVFLFAVPLNAQNIQVLNGVGSDKTYVNFVTAELFKPLDHGKFYGFTDLKINQEGYFDSYTELFGYLSVNKLGLYLTGQVNAGLFTVDGAGYQIFPVYLLGVSKEVVVNDVVLSLDVLYRIDKGISLDGQRIGDGAQLTGTFLKDWEYFQISGYCDLFQSEHSEYYNKNRNSLIVQFEPQAWWKFSQRLYLGIEGRLSNFTDPDLGLYEHSNYCMVGLKWNLE